jgi:NTP pyrophosphatase (non-canonical NTP hydrolase)
LLSVEAIQKQVNILDKETKNVDMCLLRLVAEVGELVNYATKEILRGEDHRKEIKGELADIIYYTAKIADLFNFKLEDVFNEKMMFNATKYNRMPKYIQLLRDLKNDGLIS